MEQWKVDKLIAGMHNRSQLNAEKWNRFKEIYDQHPIDEEKGNDDDDHKNDDEQEVVEEEEVIIDREDNVPEPSNKSESDEEEEEEEEEIIEVPPAFPSYFIPPLSVEKPVAVEEVEDEEDDRKSHHSLVSNHSEPSSVASQQSIKPKNDIMNLLQSLAKEKAEKNLKSQIEQVEVESVVSRNSSRPSTPVVVTVVSSNNNTNKVHAVDHDIDEWMTEDRICKIKKRCTALVEKLGKGDNYLAHNMRNCMHDEGKWIAMEKHLTSIEEEETTGQNTYSYMERGAEILEKMIGWININGITAEGLTDHLKSIYDIKFDPVARKPESDKDKKNHISANFRFTDEDSPKEYVLADYAFWEVLNYVILRSKPAQMFDKLTKPSSPTPLFSQHGKLPKPPSMKIHKQKNKSKSKSKKSKSSKPHQDNHEQLQQLMTDTFMEMMKKYQQSAPVPAPTQPVPSRPPLQLANDDGLPDMFDDED